MGGGGPQRGGTVSTNFRFAEAAPGLAASLTFKEKLAPDFRTQTAVEQRMSDAIFVDAEVAAIGSLSRDDLNVCGIHCVFQR